LRRFIDIIWVAVLSAIVAIALVSLVGLVARAVLDVPDGFEPLDPAPLARLALIAAIGATLVYWALISWNRTRGPQVFFWLSLVLLLVSLIGPLVVAPNDYPGIGAGPIAALIVAHLAVFIPAAGLPLVLGAGGAIRD
jgi:hypothetical protein